MRSDPANTIQSVSCHTHNNQQHKPHSQQRRRHRRRSQVGARGTPDIIARMAITQEQAIALPNLRYDVLVLDYDFVKASGDYVGEIGDLHYN